MRSSREQAVYVLGLMVLLAFAAIEFLFFIGLMSQRDKEEGCRDEALSSSGRVKTRVTAP